MARGENVERFLNVGELGILHYVAPLYPPNYRGETQQLLDFWPMAVPILKMLRLSGELIEFAGTSCELRIEAYLRNISGQSFSSNTDPLASVPITTVASSVPASAQVSSHNVNRSGLDMTVDLMYQLRWPFGKESPPSINLVRNVVEQMVRYG